jgi:hypothetical protein
MCPEWLVSQSYLYLRTGTLGKDNRQILGAAMSIAARLTAFALSTALRSSWILALHGRLRFSFQQVFSAVWC